MARCCSAQRWTPIPTSQPQGSGWQGQAIWNSTPSATLPCAARVRLTTGTGNVDGTDWACVPGIIGGKIALDDTGATWIQKDASGKVVVGTGTTRLFSIDSSGNVLAKGTITASTTP